MTPTEIQQALVDVGWPIAVDGKSGPRTRQAVADFQRGWALGPPLGVDGVAGPMTEAALRECLGRDGRCGEHFRYVEWKSKGDGWIKVARALVVGLDAYRTRWGPTGLVSGYRDPAYNARPDVGGAKSSQHLHGNAADLTPRVALADVAALGLFSGIGYQANTSENLVRHVDVRHVGPNTTGGTPAQPTLWAYGTLARTADDAGLDECDH